MALQLVLSRLPRFSLCEIDGVGDDFRWFTCRKDVAGSSISSQLSQLPASPLASLPAHRHEAARKYTVFNEAYVGTQVFLAQANSERKHFWIC